MSDTPRTDSCYQQILDEGLGLEYAEDELREWSKKLERELAEAQAEITRLKGEAESWEQVFDKTCEHLASAKTELAEAVGKERERCAKVSEEYPGALHSRQEELMAYDIAAEIRKGE
jgi:predicted  nucleic acid-binding Zn-ribbon protein